MMDDRSNGPSLELLTQRAEYLLVEETLGVPEEKIEGRGYAHGGVGLLAQHTSYYDGFAVILNLPYATAVVVRSTESEQTRIVIDGELLRWAESSKTRNDLFSPPGELHWRRLIMSLLEEFLPIDKAVHIGVVSSVPPGCTEAFLSSLSVAVVNAIFDFLQLPLPLGVVGSIKDAIEKAIESEFSKAFVMVSCNAEPGTLCIIDTATEELIPFDAPSRDLLAWGLIAVGMGSPKRFDFYHECGEKGSEALTLLTKSQFPEYTSFRDVPHADLPRVLNSLPQRYRSIVRHLVNENKRVQVMISAIRGEDWQKLGGLLLISHASLSNEWNGTNKAIDFVVSQAQNMSSDGIYGGCMTGRGGYVLIVGLPLALPHFMKETEMQLKKRFNREPNCMIL